jgi:hypothetical protein
MRSPVCNSPAGEEPAVPGHWRSMTSMHEPHHAHLVTAPAGSALGSAQWSIRQTPASAGAAHGQGTSRSVPSASPVPSGSDHRVPEHAVSLTICGSSTHRSSARMSAPHPVRHPSWRGDRWRQAADRPHVPSGPPRARRRGAWPRPPGPRTGAPTRLRAWQLCENGGLLCVPHRLKGGRGDASWAG